MARSSFVAGSFLLVYITTVFSSVQLVSSSSDTCSHQSTDFILSLQSQCPVSIYPNPPLQVDGDFLDSILASKQRAGDISVLFYASWCPFSRSVSPTFEKLSLMFPQIQHLAIEQSLAMPSVFSRYGIHSLPSILMINQTSRVHYHGPKDLLSLVQFYKKTSGLEPIQYFDNDQSVFSESRETSIFQLINSMPLKEISKKEPYLVFAILFLFLRVLLSIFPRLLFHLKAFYVSYVPHFNSGIFGETSQIMGRVCHMIDVRRVWTKLRLCKTRNFREGAKNARVWASLASVSLGESSSARSS
ncbi:5'-adenylylsulfate reductase-like 7 [Ziziphus jujuba]|uniref:5'-adenylylsulfate reductase-like 7 n=1 Tax=Ziziphus jujuba TaxID=326968 RepID=A0A6P4AMV2_ZIZJJ|nr:5'-adenylylsulfate reductase-like 7 [Ziziphus jujuba]